MRVRLLTVLTAAVALTGASPAWGADFTWSGASTSSPAWSTGANWVGGTPPASPAGTLTFGLLSGCASTSVCYASVNDIAPMSMASINLDDEAPYLMGGSPITLTGSTGLQTTAAPAASEGKPSLEMGISLGADQTWTIDGGADGLGGLLLGGQISPTARTLGVHLSRKAGVTLTPNDDELGALTLSGADASKTGTAAAGNGTITLQSGGSGTPVQLNATSGNPVNVSDVQLTAYDGTQLGALTSTGGDIQLGLPVPSPGIVSVAGMTLDSASVLAMTIGQAGTTPGTDYSQLSASGPINLGGATLSLNLGATCPTLNAGDVDTLVSTSAGGLTGTFAGVPDGGTVTTAVTPACSKQATLRINYAGSAVTATVTSVGSSVPVLTSPPSVSGNTTQGQFLSETNGTWTNSPTDYTFQWEDCDSTGANCTAIPGATNQYYLLTAGDIGHTLRVQETASNSAGTAPSPATSAPTGLVTGASALPTGPSNSLPPVITGMPAVGSTLAATTGTWSGTPPLTYSYQWWRCDSNGCSPIAGATDSTYTLSPRDLTSSIFVALTAANKGGSASQSSDEAGPVYPAAGTIAATLARALEGLGKVRLARVLNQDGFTFTVDVPGPGLVTARWYYASPVGRAASASRRVPLGSASQRVALPARTRVRLALNRRARQLLKRGKGARIIAVLSFMPQGGKRVSASKGLTLRR